jgi:hypothetical protein
MAETAGYEGSIYYRHGYVKTQLTFNDNSPSADTIVGAGSAVKSAGIVASDTFNVRSTSSNSGSYTVGSITSSTITVGSTSALTNESSVSSAILDTTPGTALAGFYNWSLNYAGEALETTDYGDSGSRTYLAGLKGWSATAQKHYLTSSSITSWLGTTARVRFFIRYDATPSASSVAVFLEGSAVVTGADTTAPVDGTVDQGLNFQGTGALNITTRTTAW